MWMGELITQRGIGNGMSLLIFASVVSSRCPSRATPHQGRRPASSLFVIADRRSSCMLVAIVFIEQGQRRIPVQFAKRVVGRRMYGGQSTYIPLKVNQAGVIPIIFASSVLLPAAAAVVRAARRRLGRERAELHQQPPVQPELAVLPRRLRPADHRLRLLLHGHHLRPGQAGRHTPQAGRLHPRHPARAPRPSATWPRSSTASRCPAPCSSPCVALLPSLVLSHYLPGNQVSVRRAPRCSSRWAWPSRP